MYVTSSYTIGSGFYERTFVNPSHHVQSTSSSARPSYLRTCVRKVPVFAAVYEEYVRCPVPVRCRVGAREGGWGALRCVSRAHTPGLPQKKSSPLGGKALSTSPPGG